MPNMTLDSFDSQDGGEESTSPPESATRPDGGQSQSESNDESPAPEQQATDSDTPASTLEQQLSDNRNGDPLSCPWCLEPHTGFRELGEGRYGCSNCSAVIPVFAAWFWRGKKVVV